MNVMILGIRSRYLPIIAHSHDAASRSRRPNVAFALLGSHFFRPAFVVPVFVLTVAHL